MSADQRRLDESSIAEDRSEGDGVIEPADKDQHKASTLCREEVLQANSSDRSSAFHGQAIEDNQNKADNLKRQDTNGEKFEPPGATDLASLTDGRKLGQYCSIYSFWAWVQIIFELLYLIIILLFSFYVLVLLAKYILLKETTGSIHELIGSGPGADALVSWVAITLGGACGGCSAALKWLYHTVAKQRWHRDRLIWRLVVPILSAMLAVFLGLMIRSGLVPFLNNSPLVNPASGAAFGFFVGIFSDNVLSGLQKLAFKTFGTVDRS